MWRSSIKWPTVISSPREIKPAAMELAKSHEPAKKNTMDFEEINDVLGPFGKYQKFVFFLACWGSFMPAMVVVCMTFVGNNVDHRWVDPRNITLLRFGWRGVFFFLKGQFLVLVVSNAFMIYLAFALCWKYGHDAFVNFVVYQSQE